MRQKLFLSLVLLFVCSGLALAGKVLNDALVTSPFSHRVWQDVIHQAVDTDGRVDLIKLRAHPARLNEYLDQLAVVSPENRPDYFRNRDDELAYWINAHNALALRHLIDLYPLDSLPSALAFETNDRYKLGGQPYPLLKIRGKIEARFPTRPEALMALTRYTLDSPPLAHQVFEGPQLARQLQAHAGRVLAELAPEIPGCPELPHWLEAAQESLFDAAQHRMIGHQALGWNEILRRYLPPEERGRLDCAGEVRFAEPDLRLREIR